MKNSEYFRGKNVTVIGFARSGLACANLLFSLGANVRITDSQDNSGLRDNVRQLKSEQIIFELGRHTRDFIKGADICILSPGVPDSSPAVKFAEEMNIPVVSEIEVAWMLCPATVVAITGSNGKTTTTTLIARMLEASGRRTFICGNIGNPFSGEVEKMQEGDFVSLEVSSFQLERIRDFRPKVAVIINCSPNHLDRYPDMQAYLAAKKKIFSNQGPQDYLVLNGDDPSLAGLEKETKAQVIYFRKTGSFNPDQEAVLAVASALGVEKRCCLGVFSAFRGLEHRMEYVTEISGVKFINDSKATTAESTVWALQNLLQPVILICGGRHKGIDYSPVIKPGTGKIKRLVLIGEAASIIENDLGKSFPVSKAGTMEEAVLLAMNLAQSGDCVLLSPMCSSYDMFKNYEERGAAFKAAVLSLSKKRLNA